MARHFAEAILHDVPADARDAAVLMVSELASNCIRHTPNGFDLTISHNADGIRIEATDRGRGEPRMRNPGPSDPNGRGLQIVQLLSATWGVEHLTGQGKTVWFTIAPEVPSTVESARA